MESTIVFIKDLEQSIHNMYLYYCHREQDTYSMAASEVVEIYIQENLHSEAAT